MNAPSFQDLPASAYRGRFAPSPTGLLHAGSLTTAVGSYLHARSQGGQWLLRIEDLDPPREVPGAADAILRTLEALGLAWDGPVIWQSQRLTAYQDALDALIASGHAYPCACTRREIALAGYPGVDGVVYPGTCRNGLAAGKAGRAWRLHVPAGEVMFMDGHYGAQRQDVAHQVGDYVLKRADGLFAYQLAVVVDDAWQGISEVVRGADLLDSTPRQIVLQRALNAPTPRYTHLPLLVNTAGEKLSKQTLAPAIRPDQAADELRLALARLNHAPPADCQGLDELWSWALAHWSLARAPAAPVPV
ncbi:tRNA glutamyl-Q(34) synthetase GluQRS [Rivihabitans pingtungensis]|uniref:Glutamyl-Q tRNA(Asp) synthetase n=1 Tax=Rivihabitans pingtungensis TaxID=1054498 RepID=A0A318KGT4_9NEIS|nr:tRNA glutamyl-Q(34) synthetase GluQRS [Rivihabitans pingtungensis]PXX74534.1 glutamyl-Q tRNA(Asp) synthetase [Rivihabitans pingtungensis]